MNVRVKRNVSKPIIAMIGCVAALAVASVASSAEKSVKLSRNAKSGADVTIAYAGRWDDNCNGLPVTITITRAPANGTVSMLDADEVLPESTPGSDDTGQCGGKVIKSKMIMYRSNPGFSGDDTVGYDSDGNGLLIHTTIEVSVK